MRDGALSDASLADGWRGLLATLLFQRSVSGYWRGRREELLRVSTREIEEGLQSQ